MSIEASVDVEFFNPMPILTILNILKKAGWTTDDKGVKTYLPMGDNGMYNWESANISEDDLYGMLNEKEKLGEEIGLMIIWKDSDIGGLLNLRKDRTISLLCTRNRVCLEPAEITDFNWYIERFVKPFNL